MKNPPQKLSHFSRGSPNTNFTIQDNDSSPFSNDIRQNYLKGLPINQSVTIKSVKDNYIKQNQSKSFKKKLSCPQQNLVEFLDTQNPEYKKKYTEVNTLDQNVYYSGEMDYTTRLQTKDGCIKKSDSSDFINEYLQKNKDEMIKEKDYPLNDCIDKLYLFFRSVFQFIETSESNDRTIVNRQIYDGNIEFYPQETSLVNELRKMFKQKYGGSTVKDMAFKKIFKKMTDGDILRYIYSTTQKINTRMVNQSNSLKNIRNDFKFIRNNQKNFDDFLIKKDKKSQRSFIHQEIKYKSFQIEQGNQLSLDDLKNGSIYCFGRDCNLCPIVIIDFKKIDSHFMKAEELFLQFIHQTNYIIKRQLIPGQIENIVVIIDWGNLSRWDQNQNNIKRLLDLINTISYTWTSRISHIYCVNYKNISNTNFWSLMSGSSFTNCQKKVYQSDESYHENMLQHINRFQLEDKFCGYVKDQESRYWPPKTPNHNYFLHSKSGHFINPSVYHKKYQEGYFEGNGSVVNHNIIKPFEIGLEFDDKQTESFFTALSLKKSELSKIRQDHRRFSGISVGNQQTGAGIRPCDHITIDGCEYKQNIKGPDMCGNNDQMKIETIKTQISSTQITYHTAMTGSNKWEKSLGESQFMTSNQCSNEPNEYYSVRQLSKIDEFDDEDIDKGSDENSDSIIEKNDNCDDAEENADIDEGFWLGINSHKKLDELHRSSIKKQSIVTLNSE